MKTKLIFDQEGIRVYETNNGDERGKEWHITQDGGIGCSVGFKPILELIWLREYLIQYQKDRKEYLEPEIIEKPAD